MNDSFEKRPLVDQEYDGSFWRKPGSLPLINLILLSLGFLCTFTSFNATQNLESSLIPGNLGRWSLASLYAAFCIGSLLIAPIAVNWTGPKLGVIIGSITYTGFIAANINPLWPSMITCAVVIGVGASIIWASQGAYVTAAAASYAREKKEPIKSAMGLFTGIFFMILQCSQVIGNVISSVVLMQGSLDTAKTTLFYVFVALSGVGTMLLCLVKNITVPAELLETDTVSTKERLLGTILLWRDKRMLLFIPALFYSGLELGFVAGDFTNELIEQNWVGYVMAAFGAADSISSITLAKFAEKFGKLPLLFIGFITQISFLIFYAIVLKGNIFTADDIKDKKYILFATAAIYGIGDAVWQVFPSTMMSIYFTDKTEAAFSNLKLFQSLGFVCAFGWTSLAFEIKIYIVGVVACIATGSILVLNWLEPINDNKYETLINN